MATAAAAVIAKAKRDIQHQFFGQDAVRPDRAIDFDPSRHAQRRVFERWQRAGIIRETEGGRYWLDVVAYDADLRGRYQRLRIALLAIVLLALIGFALRIIVVRP